jgi:hypothetical protein
MVDLQRHATTNHETGSSPRPICTTTRFWLFPNRTMYDRDAAGSGLVSTFDARERA